MLTTGYDEEAVKIGLVRPATPHLRLKLMLALIACVVTGATLAYVAKIVPWRI